MMKTKINIFITLAIILLMSSCNNFLDIKPENTLPVPVDSSAYDVSTMFQPVAGIYSASKSFCSWVNAFALVIRGDDDDKGGTPTDQPQLLDMKHFNYGAAKDYWLLNAVWSNYYSIIQNSNSALLALNNYVPNLKTAADKQLNLQYQAEVRFIRAYSYFFIVRLWGSAPLFTDNLSSDVFKKASREEMYAFINSELDFCIANLPALHPAEMEHKGSVTKYTALTLKAKVASDLGTWNVALDATNQIINSGKFSLFNSYSDLFRKNPANDGRLCSESIFEIQVTDNATTDLVQIELDNYFQSQGPANPGFIGADISSGWGFMCPTQTLIDFFNSRGETVRYKTQFLFTSIKNPNGTITYSVPEGDTLGVNNPGLPTVYNGKLYQPSSQMRLDGSTSYGAGNNVKTLRYADVLLLNAEAKINLGQNGDAPLNLVRARAGMPAITGATVDQVLDERRVEFACEFGERFFDLVRTGKAAATLPGFVAGQSEFYPIPQAQIDQNPNLAN